MLAWEPVSHSEEDTVWDNFYEQFDFRPTVYPDKFPSIKEPKGSITYQFEYPSAENEDRAINDINHKALISFRNITSSEDVLYALDWQHDCYWFRPHLSFEKWYIPVFANGDYSIFLAKDLSFGIFAHPWEQTFCVWGNMLLIEFHKNQPLLFEKVIRQN